MAGTRSHAAGWSDVKVRRRWVAAFRRAVADRLDPLASLISQETGKPRWEAITADIMPLLIACRWLERRGPGALRPRRVPGSIWTIGTRATVRHAPLGDVAIVATWNYPVQLLGIQLAQALFAGNRVVVKPSERSWRTQRALCRLAQNAGLPDGVLEVYDQSREAGARLLESRRFDHIVFTGSTAVGSTVARRGAASLTPSTLELSGRDSAFVLADADPSLAAKSLWNAVAMNGGQTCMAPRRILIDRAVAPRFEQSLLRLAGDERGRTLISEEEAARVVDLVADAVSRGGRPSCHAETGTPGVLRPVAVFDCPAGAPLVEGRHFGPAVAVVAVDSLEQALQIHRACDQHLATSVFTRNAHAARELAARLGSTTVTINDCVVPVGHPGVSIGGRGSSGWGLSRGVDGLLSMTRPVFETRTSALLRAPVGPPSPALAKWLPRAIRFAFGSRRSRAAALPDWESDPSSAPNPRQGGGARGEGTPTDTPKVPVHV